MWTPNGKFHVERCAAFLPNLTGATFQSDPINLPNTGTSDRLYFPTTLIPGGIDATGIMAFTEATERQASPHWGWRPAPWSTPNLLASDVTALMTIPPGFLSPNGARYPMIWGGQVYRICDMFMSSLPAKFHFASSHNYYSYGQDLTIVNVPGLSWSYKGRSSCVYLDANTMKLMRAGLGIILNDGVTDNFYVVTGVFPGLGYVQVNSMKPDGVAPTNGTKTTIYTGTLIKQQAYAITQF